MIECYLCFMNSGFHLFNLFYTNIYELLNKKPFKKKSVDFLIYYKLGFCFDIRTSRTHLKLKNYPCFNVSFSIKFAVNLYSILLGKASLNFMLKILDSRQL